MSDKDPQRFVTHDLALAAYLLMRGLVLKSAQKSANKFEFIFEDPANEAQKLSFEFIGSDFAAYDGYIRSLRGLLYQK